MFKSNEYDNEGKLLAKKNLENLIRSKYANYPPTANVFKSLLKNSMPILNYLYPERTFYIFAGVTDPKNQASTSGNEDF